MRPYKKLQLLQTVKDIRGQLREFGDETPNLSIHCYDRLLTALMDVMEKECDQKELFKDLIEELGEVNETDPQRYQEAMDRMAGTHENN